MNWDQIEGKWKQLKGSAKQHFGKLTDDDLEQIRGKRDILIGKLQERYGIVKEQAQQEADEWFAAAMPPTSNQQMNQQGSSKPGHRTGQHAS